MDVSGHDMDVEQCSVLLISLPGLGLASLPAVAAEPAEWQVVCCASQPVLAAWLPPGYITTKLVGDQYIARCSQFVAVKLRLSCDGLKARLHLWDVCMETQRDSGALHNRVKCRFQRQPASRRLSGHCR